MRGWIEYREINKLLSINLCLVGQNQKGKVEEERENNNKRLS